MLVNHEEHCWSFSIYKRFFPYLRRVTTQLYFNSAPANFFNEKFVAVGNSLPSLNWPPLPVDYVPSQFLISVEDTERALATTKHYSAVGSDEIAASNQIKSISLFKHGKSTVFFSNIIKIRVSRQIS